MATSKVIAFTERHQRLISVVGAVWLALSCAVYARFIVLPDLPFLTDEVVLFSGAAYNAVWYGFVRPAVERRKKLEANTD